MSDTSLNLKWRPKKFSELEGQLSVSQVLTNALQSNSLHPALIFSGPKGTGKTSCARILAKALRCQKRKGAEPCNTCTLCVSAQNESDMDIIEIDGASNTGVDSIRHLKDSVQYMPQAGDYKIYIIDEVHMLSQNAFNALLKTLEEPPQHVIFIMATTELRKIPATVISRCQTLYFHPISGQLIQKKLQEICKVEKIQIDKEALWLIVEQAQGSMRDAQVLLEQMSSLGNKKITSDIIIQSLGLTQRSLLNSILEGIVQRKTKDILNLIHQLQHIDHHTFLNNISSQIRNLILIQIMGDTNSSLIFLTDKEKTYLKELSQHIQPEDLHFLFDMCLKGKEDLKKSFDTQMTLEMILIRMSQWPRIELLTSDAPYTAPPSTTKPLSLKKKTDSFSSDEKKSKDQKTSHFSSLVTSQNKQPSSTKVQPTTKTMTPSSDFKTTSKNTTSSHRAPSSSKASGALFSNTKTHTAETRSPVSTTPLSEKTDSKKPSTTSPTPSNTLSSIDSLWNQFLEFIQKTSPRMGAEMKSFSFKSLEGEKLTLTYPKSLLFLKEKTSNTKFLKDLDKHLTAFFKKKIEPSFILNDENSEYQKKFDHEKNQRMNNIKQVSKDPLVQKISNLFQAHVVEEPPHSSDLKDLS